MRSRPRSRGEVKVDGSGRCDLLVSARRDGAAARGDGEAEGTDAIPTDPVCERHGYGECDLTCCPPVQSSPDSARVARHIGDSERTGACGTVLALRVCSACPPLPAEAKFCSAVEGQSGERVSSSRMNEQQNLTCLHHAR